MLKLLGFFVSLACAAGVFGASPALITPRSADSLSAAGNSFAPTFSGGGRYVTFLSHANNLLTNGHRTPHLDLFVRDLETGHLDLISVSAAGTDGSQRDVASFCVASNHQRIAFMTLATNLAAGDNPRLPEIFTRDMLAQQTELGAVDISGEPLVNFPFEARMADPMLSADGRYLVYSTDGTNVVALVDTNRTWDVIIRDYVLQTNVMVSPSALAATTANGTSRLLAATADAASILFVSSATDLLTDGPTNRLNALYLRDVVAGTTTWVSRHMEQYVNGPFDIRSAALSSDGRLVAFKAGTTNQPNACVFLFDGSNGTTTNLTCGSSPESALAMSIDGTSVIYDESGQLYRYDTVEQSATLITHDHASPMTPAAGVSKHPVLSPNGRWLTFVGSATNLAGDVDSGRFQIYLTNLETGDTRLITRAQDGTPSKIDHELAASAVRDDGSVAFDSRDEHLVLGDSNDASDVFLRTIDPEQTTLVSVRHADLPSVTREGFHTIGRSSISSDGNKVVFSRVDRASGFVSRAAIRDLTNQQTEVLNLLTNECAATDISTRDVVISGNGRYAAFLQSCASGAEIVRQDLVTGEMLSIARFKPSVQQLLTNGSPCLSYDGDHIVYHNYTNVYVTTISSNTTELVSVNAAGTGGGNGLSYAPILSPNRRYVLFSSYATDLLSPATGRPNVFVRDLQAKTTRALGFAETAAFATGSRHATFVGGYPRQGFLYDLLSQATTLIANESRFPSVNADARWAVYQTDGSGIKQIVVRDMQTGVTNLVSKSVSGLEGGNANSTTPLITSEGRYVVFLSRATNLVAEITGGEANLFVYDRIQSTTWLATAGIPGIGRTHQGSMNPVLGPDGHTVVFESFAGNLTRGDYNEERDLFILRLGGGDTDGDALADDWEVAYFGNLSRNGSQDFDQDGHTDALEFTAGTDPTNKNSVFRVFTLSSGSAGTRIFWNAVPGKTYRAEYKDTLQDPWQSLGSGTANSAASSFLDAAVRPTRFYRVVLD